MKLTKIMMFASMGLFFAKALIAAEAGSVCFKTVCFYPEIAKVSSEKQRGLMGREKLSETGGMLFVYEREVQPAFWMKNMRIPLDFIWLNSEGRAVAVNENVPACTSSSCPTIESQSPAQYVLEIPAGSIQKFKISLQDQATIKWGN